MHVKLPFKLHGTLPARSLSRHPGPGSEVGAVPGRCPRNASHRSFGLATWRREGTAGEGARDWTRSGAAVGCTCDGLHFGLRCGFGLGFERDLRSGRAVEAGARRPSPTRREAFSTGPGAGTGCLLQFKLSKKYAGMSSPGAGGRGGRDQAESSVFGKFQYPAARHMGHRHSTHDPAPNQTQTCTALVTNANSCLPRWGRGGGGVGSTTLT